MRLALFTGIIAYLETLGKFQGEYTIAFLGMAFIMCIIQDLKEIFVVK